MLLYTFHVNLASSFPELTRVFQVHDKVNSLRANHSRATFVKSDDSRAKLVKSKRVVSYTGFEFSRVLVTVLLLVSSV